MLNKKKQNKKKQKPLKKRVSRTAEQRERKRRRKINVKRKKELEKLLRKRSKQHGPNPYSAVRYHQGYVYDKIRYTVLTASQMPSEREEMVSSTMKTVTSGPEAMTLPENPGWATTQVGHDGRVYIISYLGTEVALFFKRQLTEIIPEPGEKVPEGVLQDPKEAWQRLDLLGRSAEKSHFVLTQQHRRIEEANKLLTSRASGLDDLNDSLKRSHYDLTRVVARLQGEKQELEKKLRAALRLVPKRKRRLSVWEEH